MEARGRLWGLSGIAFDVLSIVLIEVYEVSVESEGREPEQGGKRGSVSEGKVRDWQIRN
jgi:hypothetical protein